MKNITVFLLFLSAFLLQSTVFIHLRIIGIAPDLLLCLVVSIAFLFKENIVILLGVLFGLLQDVCFSPLIGPTAIALLILAVFTGYLKGILHKDSMISILIISLTGTVLYQLLCFSIMTVFGGNYAFTHVIMALPVLCGYNFAVMLIIYLTIGRRSIRYPQDRYYRGSYLNIE